MLIGELLLEGKRLVVCDDGKVFLLYDGERTGPHLLEIGHDLSFESVCCSENSCERGDSRCDDKNCNKRTQFVAFD